VLLYLVTPEAGSSVLICFYKISQTLIWRFTMNNQQKEQPEQSGKQLALGIVGFIVGTIVILYLLKVFLF
jgi:hypothetical protein